jgi:hypothetical protein
MPLPKGGHRYDPDEVAAVIRAQAGLTTYAARALGMSHDTIKRYIRDFPVCEQAFEDTRAEVLDLAESTLYKAIKAGDMQATLFYLKTQGRSRGYSEHFDLRAWLLERAEALAEERGLDKALAAAQVERIMLGSGRRAG